MSRLALTSKDYVATKSKGSTAITSQAYFALSFGTLDVLDGVVVIDETKGHFRTTIRSLF